MLTRYALLLLVAGTVAQTALAQNSNSSTSAPARPRATNTNSQPKTTGQQPTGTQKPAAPQAQKKPVVATEQPAGSDGVLAAFNHLLEGFATRMSTPLPASTGTRHISPCSITTEA
jgi:hypothetical protein